MEKKIVVGVLAHVDAGKTTLVESIMFQAGELQKPGRVDHRDTFLDTDEQERDRGITIFSKQARFAWKGMETVLLDTPGHVDFSAETERTLQVLDYAILIISGADGVQGHTLTLWKLLERYQVPVFLFVNKLDQPGTDSTRLSEEIRQRLGENCIAFGGDADCVPEQSEKEFRERAAVCDDTLLEKYLEWEENGQGGCPVTTAVLTELIAQRKIFPCYYGSALKQKGIAEFLDGLAEYTRMPQYGQEQGIRVYKIARDEQGTRLTYVKLTGGSLKVKQFLGEEKVDQIRLYSGSRYEAVQEAGAGDICALTGLSHTFCGQGFGIEKEGILPALEPVMTYRITLPEGSDIHQSYVKLCQLEEEEPQLHIVWNEQLGEIHAQLMGEVQIEILRQIIRQRFGMDVEFEQGNVVYKETIADTVEGVGHFEPLRHYAEVHLLLQPGERGSGLQFQSSCSEDLLDRNWQRLILTHLEEKEHLGVLIGAPLTDMQITLVAGRAHPKHTEGGDFRQATYRAVRQGLCKAQSVLLEPVYSFRMELPRTAVGRAMTDIQKKGGRFEQPEQEGELAVLTGVVPVAAMHGYQTEFMAYTGGRGRMSTVLRGYEPCHNAQEVIDAACYEAERDLDNPCGSVFCAHGAGFVVDWDQVEEYMHLEPVLNKEQREEVPEQALIRRRTTKSSSVEEDFIGQDEIEEIFQRTFGTSARTKPGWAKRIRASQPQADSAYRGKARPEQEYLLVDGYNIIFGWQSLRELASSNLDGARGVLMDVLSNYQGFCKAKIILVFDAYKVKGNPGSTMRYHNLDVVYTKEAETADQYIEKTAHRIARDCHIRVATSDGLEQMIILGAGAVRVSAREFEQEVMTRCGEQLEEYRQKREDQHGDKTYLLDGMTKEVADFLEQHAQEWRQE